MAAKLNLPNSDQSNLKNKLLT